jgi:hypothetical protein
MIELAAYNGIANPNIVFVGQKIADPQQRRAADTAAAQSGALPGEAGYTCRQRRGDALRNRQEPTA